MFYRRKSYIVKSDFVEVFNKHFNETNLPNQLKRGAKLVGRWMHQNDEETTCIFAIWEYDSYEKYVEIETTIKADNTHVQRIHDWYDSLGGRDNVYKNYILEVKNERLESTLL